MMCDIALLLMLSHIAGPEQVLRITAFAALLMLVAIIPVTSINQLSINQMPGA